MTIDPEKLRSAMRAWTRSHCYASFEGSSRMTVNSCSLVSLDPAWITISLQQSSRTRDLIHRSEAFGITILTQDQQELADRFAGRIPDMEDRFTGLETVTYQTGAPLIKNGLAHMDCRLVQSIDVGMNTLFIAEVVEAYTDISVNRYPS
jgi:flavin reductase (DIM6/NTAB) family NADH-FMN oxidoreductase RutF